MPDEKYVRYIGSRGDEVVAYPHAGGSVTAKKGERVQVTAEQHKELTSDSGAGNWEDASTTRKSE